MIIKTPLMRLIELRHHKPIEQLIASGSLRQVARNLGVNYTTVHQWRKELRQASSTHAAS